MSILCNPINMSYKYQFAREKEGFVVYREAADPSMIYFNDKYFIFLSMTAGFLASDDLVNWTYHPLKNLPIYDYAPDVRVVGDYMYFTASKFSANCPFYRTKDPIAGEYEMIEGSFPFWDPHLFADDDGRLYFYWGCSNEEPIYGVEMDPETMKPVTEPLGLISGDTSVKGYERTGDNHVRTAEQSPNPFVEGAWMDKYNGKYYFQYATPGTEYNVYANAVYISDHPLGPFTLAENNPYSYKPGGFINGAGHGSTMRDRHGNYWHAATMSISVNHIFERRIGIWPAGFDEDGELFCNQRYGDWPMRIEQGKMDPWRKPEWMLLSYNKPATASSHVPGKEPTLATNENVRNWWRAATNEPGEWLEVDLLHPCDVHAIQINFADDAPEASLPEGINPKYRYIEERPSYTRWVLEGSLDGKEYFVIEDKSEAMTDLPHDLIVREDGIKARYIRCTVKELPYNQAACISGLRVFGRGLGELPKKVRGVHAELVSDLDLYVRWEPTDAVGYNVLWGHAPNKLYHSYMVLGSHEVTIGALVKGQPIYVRVDVFNEVGITEGEVIEVVKPK